MHYGTLYKQLEPLWPGVEAHGVCSALCEASKTDPALAALVDVALKKAGPEAATALMEPLAAQLDPAVQTDHRDVLNGLDVLIRAGGDPTAALPAVTALLPGWRTTAGAAGVLRRAALSGWSLVPVAPQFDAWKGPDAPERVAQIHRLAALQARGEGGVVRTLGRVYDAQPIANLFGGIGVLEAHLLSPGGPAANEVLAALQAAGSDLTKSWIALVPAWEVQLRVGDPAVQRDAAAAVSQAPLLFAATE